MSKPKDLRVLLAVDGSPHSEAAVKLVTKIAWPAGSMIDVVAVAPERWSLLGLSVQAQRVVEETLAKVQQVERATAERLAARTTAELRAHDLCAAPDAREGRPAEAILERAAELQADLIVIGARGLSAPGDFHLGSTAHKLANRATCSVLVARPAPRAELLSVILAADGSPEAQRAADLLCRLALPQWAEVLVVGVAEVAMALPAAEGEARSDVPALVRRALLDAAETRVAEVVTRLRECEAEVRSAVRFGHPAGEILAAAREDDADLIAIGARGQTRAGPLPLGGVAQKVAKYATCSALVVR